MSKTEISKLKLTYGEGAMLQGVIDFIEFLCINDEPLPTTREALDRVLASYVKYIRKGNMQYVQRLRKERGQSPLLEKLLNE